MIDTRRTERIEAARSIAKDSVRDQAAKNDRECALPIAAMSRMAETGLLRMGIAEEWGGEGLSVLRPERPYEYLEIMEEFGAVDMAVAHCLQVHFHATDMLSNFAGSAQQELFLEPAARNGSLFSWVGSEVGRSDRGQFNLETTATETADGYILNGRKNFATLASVADFNIITAALADGPPGAEGVMLIVVPKGSPGFDFDASWWQPLGMRSTVSPTLTLDHVQVPATHVILGPGEYPRLARMDVGWRLNLSFAANFIGGLWGMISFATDFVHKSPRPARQEAVRSLGRAASRQKAAKLVLQRAAEALEENDDDASTLAVMSRYVAIEAATSSIPDIIEALGSRALFTDLPLQRFIRDIYMQSTHSKQYVLSETIGADILGTDRDFARQI